MPGEQRRGRKGEHERGAGHRPDGEAVAGRRGRDQQRDDDGAVVRGVGLAGHRPDGHGEAAPPAALGGRHRQAEAQRRRRAGRQRGDVPAHRVAPAGRQPSWAGGRGRVALVAHHGQHLGARRVRLALEPQPADREVGHAARAAPGQCDPADRRLVVLRVDLAADGGDRDLEVGRRPLLVGGHVEPGLYRRLAACRQRRDVDLLLGVPGGAHRRRRGAGRGDAFVRDDHEQLDAAVRRAARVVGGADREVRGLRGGQRDGDRAGVVAERGVALLDLAVRVAVEAARHGDGDLPITGLAGRDGELELDRRLPLTGERGHVGGVLAAPRGTGRRGRRVSLRARRLHHGADGEDAAVDAEGPSLEHAQLRLGDFGGAGDLRLRRRPARQRCKRREGGDNQSRFTLRLKHPAQGPVNPRRYGWVDVERGRLGRSLAAVLALGVAGVPAAARADRPDRRGRA